MPFSSSRPTSINNAYRTNQNVVTTIKDKAWNGNYLVIRSKGWPRIWCYRKIVFQVKNVAYRRYLHLFSNVQDYRCIVYIPIQNQTQHRRMQTTSWYGKHIHWSVTGLLQQHGPSYTMRIFTASFYMGVNAFISHKGSNLVEILFKQK